MLVAESLNVNFGTEPALTDASFSVDPGETVAVVGRSGSGKSTLLHCLAGILRPDTGTVKLNGHRIDNTSDDELSVLRRTQFGFVFQFGELVPELTLVDNVALPLRFAGVSRREGRRRAAFVLAELGIDGLADRLPGHVSGGQAQRAAVARAMVHEPTVVFADEPTGALDTDSGEKVLAALHALTRKRGTAVVLVTHDLRVARGADRLVTVVDGRIESAPPTPDDNRCPAFTDEPS